MSSPWTPNPVGFETEWEALDPRVREAALDFATASLQMLTFYRVGTDPITVRPCPDARCSCFSGWSPILWEGQWYNCACGSRCRPASEILLDGPVGAIYSIRVDGVELDPHNGDWRVDNGNRLVWQGLGPSPIPEVQNLSRPDTEVGTWSITYSHSYPVSSRGEIAVARLAFEYAKALGKAKGKCSLPKGVSNVVRNGVSFTIEAGLFPGGLTGDEITDAFILEWAPAGSPVRTATVFDPKRMKARRPAHPHSPLGGSN